jgi:hypothetical protein
MSGCTWELDGLVLIDCSATKPAKNHSFEQCAFLLSATWVHFGLVNAKLTSESMQISVPTAAGGGPAAWLGLTSPTSPACDGGLRHETYRCLLKKECRH